MDLIKTSKDSLDISDTEETFFNLSVSIYEGRDFVWLDTPTQIIVKFGREKKHTAVHPPTKNPYFNEYFVFDFSGLFNQLLDIPLSIKVYSSKYGPVGKGLLASARFDLATIWLQPNHFISRKLVVLSHPNDPRGNVKGYVLCDLGITSPGVPLPLSTEVIGKPTVIQKGDYFAPDKLGGGKLKAKYSVNIYRAVGLNVSLEEQLIEDEDDYDGGGAAPRKGKQKVRVYFAGMSGVTSNRFKRREPTWNEEIVFTEVFPPLYSRMRIDLYNDKKVFCTRYINLFKISDSNIKGFLPTFGPSFLHMYCPVYEYFGSLLVAVTTQTLAALPEKKKLVGIKREPVNPIEENTYWTTDEFVVFAMVNSVSSIDKSQAKQKLVFSMCLGDNERKPYDHLTNHFLCRPQETVLTSGGHCQIKDSDEKITFFIIKILPDTRHRLFVSNCLDKITSALAAGIEKSYSFSEHDEGKASAILMSAVTEFLRNSSRVRSKELLAFTQLHKERIKVVKHNLGLAQDVFESRDFRKAPIALRLKTAAKHCKHIMRLIDDPQDNFPLLIFKAYAKNRKVLAYCRFSLREVLFSPDDIESGRYCGVLQTLNLKIPFSVVFTELSPPA
ncbi:hypothetical protein GE061_005670 [Apolygus lucorum]|uniref:Uncharacterized protein n=1 Tax=Apolygus lucorum TaxID=248454 RepID=A0A6A4IZL2_APOLU|nr:hypothetical protein GE061_005670 [Apolygus lucorum]